MHPQIPYVDIAAQHALIKSELLRAAERVFEHGQFVLGPEVEEFERRMAELCGARYAVGVNSGTDAEVLVLKALGIGPGDEVITVPNSYIATASAIALAGATPRFVDVREDYTMDPALLERAITGKTKAIVPVHLTGLPADMDPILEIACRHGLFVVEDAAQAVGALYHDKPVGSLGMAGCFSLHPLKTLNACGDGGVVTTNDQETYERLICLRNIGLKTRDEAVVWSGNSRLDTLQAAFLLVKLGHLDTWTERRRNNARRYRELLSNVTEVTPPTEPEGTFAVYHTFVVQAEDRDGLKQHLSDQGVGSAIHYPIPIHLQPAAKDLGHKPGDFPVAEAQAGRILSLPIHQGLQQAEIERIAAVIRSFYGR